MVKIPKDLRKGRRVIFRDERGRFVAESERYQKAKRVDKQFRGHMETIWQGKKLSPKTLADLLNRNEFESLAPNYGNVHTVTTNVKKYTAWDLSNKLEKEWGIRGRVLKVTMNIMDGTRLRKVSFYRKARRRGAFAYGFFQAMNKAIGNEKMFLYDKVGSKLIADRKGKKVSLKSIEYRVEL